MAKKVKVNKMEAQEEAETPVAEVVKPRKGKKDKTQDESSSNGNGDHTPEPKNGKKVKEKPSVDFSTKIEKKTEGVYVPTSEIVSNSAQSRGMGVIANLNADGWGLFTQLKGHKHKKPLWELLHSEKPEERKLACTILEDQEPELVELAKSMKLTGQLQAIGVRRLEDDGGLDVIYGMRRVIAICYLNASNPDSEEEVKVDIYEQEFTAVQLRLLAIDENNNREDENPMDRALTYKWLMEEGGLTKEEVSRRCEKGTQSIDQYLKLLDPLLKDKWQDIRSGKLKVEPALKLLTRLKKGESEDSTRETKEGKRYRFPSLKKMVRWYNTNKKPKEVKPKEWELLHSPDVVALFKIWLGIKPMAIEEEEVQQQVEEVAEEGEEQGPVVKVGKSKAIRLLVAMGKEDAKTWGEGDIKDRLENIVNIVDDEAAPLEEKLQELLDKLIENYKAGGTVVLFGK